MGKTKINNKGVTMESGIILNNDGSQTTDDCGDGVRLIISSSGSLVINQNGHQIVLESDVVQLLQERLNS